MLRKGQTPLSGYDREARVLIRDVFWEISRARHRAGLDQDSRGLYQYVVEDEAKVARPADTQPGPRVIDLNDSPKVEPKRRCASVAEPLAV